MKTSDYIFCTLYVILGILSIIARCKISFQERLDKARQAAVQQEVEETSQHNH